MFKTNGFISAFAVGLWLFVTGIVDLRAELPFVLVVNSENKVAAISRQDAELIFLSKKRSWPNEGNIRVVVNENPQIYSSFSYSVLRKTPTYTGTARGTYKPIGRVVDYAVRRGKSSATTDYRKKKYFVYNGKKYRLGFGEGARYQEHKFQTRAYKDRVISLFVFE